MPYRKKKDIDIRDLSCSNNSKIVRPDNDCNIRNDFYDKEVYIGIKKNEYAYIGEPIKRSQRKAGNIKIGKVIQDGKRKDFYLTTNDIKEHMFICGPTGQGKSNFLKYFLLNYYKTYDTPFIMFVYKNEYNFLSDYIDDLIILKPGINFSINIFDPRTLHPNVHAAKTFKILESGKLLVTSAEFTPQMEKVITGALKNVAENKSLQNWDGFKEVIEKFCKKKKSEGNPTYMRTIDSIDARLLNYSRYPLKKMFEVENEISIDNLFDHKVIIDLSSIYNLGGDKDDAVFFMNMILKLLFEKNMNKGVESDNEIKHLVIIEDAQYFAEDKIVKKSTVTTYLEDIALIERAYGECLITIATRPDISRNILSNSNTILFTKANFDYKIANQLLNLSKIDFYILGQLEKGQFIIKPNSKKYPLLITVPIVDNKLLNKFLKLKSKKNRIHKNQKKKKTFIGLLENLSSFETKDFRIIFDTLKKGKNAMMFTMYSYKNIKNIIPLLNDLLEKDYFNYYSIQLDLSNSDKSFILINYFSNDLNRLIKDSYLVNEILNEKINEIKTLKNDDLYREFLYLIQKFTPEIDLYVRPSNRFEDNNSIFLVQNEETTIIYDFYTLKPSSYIRINDMISEFTGKGKKAYLIFTFTKKDLNISYTSLLIRINIFEKNENRIHLDEIEGLNKINLEIDDIKSLILRHNSKLNLEPYNANLLNFIK